MKYQPRISLACFITKLLTFLLTVSLFFMPGCMIFSSDTSGSKHTETESSGYTTDSKDEMTGSDASYHSTISEDKGPESGSVPVTEVFTEDSSDESLSVTAKEKPASESKSAAACPEIHGVQNREIQSGQLTAGEWRDLENWNFWINLFNNRKWSRYQEQWGFYSLKKLSAVVKSKELPIQDASVKLMDNSNTLIWHAKTNNYGKAELFINMFYKKQEGPYKMTVETGKSKKTFSSININSKEPVELNIDSKNSVPGILDLMFVVDTTGSMSDELEFLKSELKDVIRKIRDDNHNDLKIRLSVNYYRDRNDDYIIRSFPFTEEIDKVISQINKQRANGGGDFEESVDLALEDGVFKHEWSKSAKAKILFLVLDAPPHNTGKIKDNLIQIIQGATSKGIRIIPVASSGIDKNTEFLLRFFGISTGGSYVFLTDDSGIGNDHLEPTIGEYNMELLNKLLIRIVNRYLE